MHKRLGAEYVDTTKRETFNLAQQATTNNDYKACGSLFQWGRKVNGHGLMQRIDGATGRGKHEIPTSTLFFVAVASKPYDWRLYPDKYPLGK